MNKNLTIEEIKSQKYNLELTIKGLLENFELNTGVIVDYVNIYKKHNCQIQENNEKEVISSVKLSTRFD